MLGVPRHVGKDVVKVLMGATTAGDFDLRYWGRN